MNKRFTLEAKYAERPRKNRGYFKWPPRLLGGHVCFVDWPAADSEWNSSNRRAINRIWHDIHYKTEYTIVGSNQRWTRALHMMDKRTNHRGMSFQHDFTEEHLMHLWLRDNV